MRKQLHFFSVLGLFVLASAEAGAQGGWVQDTNPQSDVSNYTTIFPYVGAAFVDMNGDEFPDILASPDVILLNNGDGTFYFGASLNFNQSNGAAGSSWADLDNDGDNDCVVAGTPSRVFFNDGLASFSDSSSQVPQFNFYGSWAAAIGDFNEDPYPDIIFAHASGFHVPAIPEPCRFYTLGASSFTPQQVTGYPFTDTLDTYTNPFWSDYDLDGDMDLFIANGPAGTPGYDVCYRNLKIETGQDTLIPMTFELFSQQLQDGQCYNFIDYDNDLDFDLCITNYAGATTRLYRHVSDSTYVTIATPFTGVATNLANCWGDYDNDADIDLIVTNDNQPSRYYRNNGNGTFSYLPGGFRTNTAVCSAVNGDFDNDGDLDIFVNGIGNNGNTSSTGLYINDTVAGNRGWVNFRLQGVTSNRSAIGAIVKIKAVVNGNPLWQIRELNAQNSFQGQNDLRIHFGLNDASAIDSVVVIWPSGLTEDYVNLTVNNFYVITEGLGIINLSVPHYSAMRTCTIFPNPAQEHVVVTTQSGEELTYKVMDMQGRMLLSGTSASPQFNIDISSLQSGMYFLTVSDGKSTAGGKFVRM